MSQILREELFYAQASCAPISAQIVVRNEEGKIQACLESLKDAVSEIILIHDGDCDDRTLEIARDFTDKIFVTPWIGEAEPHRPFAFEQATQPWILMIDGDEFLTPELAARIAALVSDPTISGYELKWNIAYPHEPVNYKYKRALVRKADMEPYKGVPHEQVRLRGRVERIELELGHNRASSAAQMRHKLTIWPQVHGRALAAHRLKQVPAWILPLGYACYVPYMLWRRIWSGEDTTCGKIWGSTLYYTRVWHAFCRQRLFGN